MDLDVPHIPAARVNLETPSVLAILEAAERCFGRGGFHATSMREVAQEAGVSKALIHYHFDSKESLFLEMLGVLYRDVVGQIEGIVRTVPPGVAAAVLALDALQGVMQRLSPLTPVLAEVGVVALRESKLRARTGALLVETRRLVEKGIEHLMGQEISRLPVSPGDLARLILSSLHGITLTAMYEDEPQSRQLLALKDILVSALRAEEPGRMQSVAEDPPNPGDRT